MRALPVGEDVVLAYQDHGGPGTPVVLLHGLAGHAGEWDETARRLSPGRRVVTVDQRGHGASSRRPADVSRAAYVADAVAIGEHLGLDRPVLAGQSLGGHTAMLAAALHPGRFRALVLVEAGAGGPNPDFTADDVAAWLRSWPVPFPTLEAAQEFFTDQDMPPAWADGLELRDGGLWPRFDPDVMAASLAENATRSWWDEWAAVDCPTLVVLGEHGIVPAADVDEMRRLRPDTTFAVVPGAGHDVHLEQPEALYELLSGFPDGIA